MFWVTNIVSGELDASGVFEKVINIPSVPSKDELRAQNVTHLFESLLFGSIWSSRTTPVRSTRSATR
jgi:hypothetical protein